jgi:hypothetical protein
VCCEVSQVTWNEFRKQKCFAASSQELVLPIPFLHSVASGKQIRTSLEASKGNIKLYQNKNLQTGHLSFFTPAWQMKNNACFFPLTFSLLFLFPKKS